MTVVAGLAAALAVWAWTRPAGAGRFRLPVATRRRQMAADRVRAWPTRLRGARDERRALGPLCRGLAAELRAGRSPVAALRAVAVDLPPPLAGVVASAAAGSELGQDPAEVLAGSALLRPVAACWQVSADTGAGLATALDRLAAACAAEQDVRDEVAAQLAGPRASAALLAGLPVLGIALASAIGAHPARFLLGTPAGGACLVAGAVLDVAGLLWIRRLAARVQL